MPSRIGIDGRWEKLQGVYIMKKFQRILFSQKKNVIQYHIFLHLSQDIDECSQTSGICSNGVCENMMGAYQCICDEGYKQAGSGTSCVDVDECAEANGGCDDLCINSPGSFSCACNSGFMLLLDGKQCKDIDECAESRNPCNGGKCINTPGGYSCICSGGLMMGPDATSCLDLDECAVNEDVCR